MKWVLCQIQSHLGSFKDNRIKIQSLIRKHSDADLLIFPELFLTGYPPEDLLEQKDFLEKQTEELKKIKSKSPQLIFGASTLKKKKIFNSVIYKKGSQIKVLDKHFLATTDTFDEMRFFTPSNSFPHIINIQGLKCLILICEDLWKIKDVPKTKKVDFIICLNASPFFPEQIKNRLFYSQQISRKLKAPLIYLNTIGAQDEWIFDGASFILDNKGSLVDQFSSFKEEVRAINPLKIKSQTKKPKPLSPIQMKKEAICMGLKNFVHRNGFKKVHVGLSGGIDSALLTLLLVEVFGKKNVTSIFLEGPFTQKISKTLSQDLAQEIGIPYIKYPITEVYKKISQQMSPLSSLAKENLQARLRNNFLMSFSNTHSSMWIGSSNKSELALGYSTLYGDLGGALMPLGDLYKTEIYKMASLYSSSSLKKISKRKPSAELAPNQWDEKSLMPYKKLDPMLKKFIENQKKPQTKKEKEIFLRVLKNEFKRRQSPLILKVSSKSFGRGRRYPITLTYPL